MASSIPPSRGHAHGMSPVPLQPVSYVRMMLHIERVEGTIFSESCSYFFRWMRAGKQVKVTAALKFAKGADFGQNMAQYVRVRRHGPVFVPEDASESLNTSLVLMTVMPESLPKIVSSLAFDIGHFLCDIVDAGKKSLSTSLLMPPSITLAIKISVKVIGENHLRPYISPHQHLQIFPTAYSSDLDEAEAARQLESLRQNVREKEDRLGVLEETTDKLGQYFELRSPRKLGMLASDDLHLKESIKMLAKERDDAQEARLEAERKNIAHVAYAAKIKDTYNQLAAWYNNLCKDHEELRHRCLSLSPGSSRDHPTSVVCVREVEFSVMQKERNELEAMLELERSEKGEKVYRSAEVLETESYSFSELREECKASQNSLISSRKEGEEQAMTIIDLQATINSLMSTLKKKDALLAQRFPSVATSKMNVPVVEESNTKRPLRDTGNSCKEGRRSLQVHKKEEEKQNISVGNHCFIDSLSMPELLEESNTLESMTLEREFARPEHVKNPSSLKIIPHIVGQEEIPPESDTSVGKRRMEEEQSAPRSSCALSIQYDSLKDDHGPLEREKRSSRRKGVSKRNEPCDTSGSELIPPKMVNKEQEVVTLSTQANVFYTPLRTIFHKTEPQDITRSPQKVVAKERGWIDVNFKFAKNEKLDSNILQSGREKSDRAGISSCVVDISAREDNIQEMNSQLNPRRGGALLCLNTSELNLVPGQNSAVFWQEILKVSEERDNAFRELFVTRKVLKNKIRNLKLNKEEVVQQLSHGVKYSHHEGAASSVSVIEPKYCIDLEKLREENIDMEANMFDMKQMFADSKLKQEDMEQELFQLNASHNTISRELDGVTHARDEISLRYEEAYNRVLDFQSEIESLKTLLDSASSSASLAEMLLDKAHKKLRESEVAARTLQAQYEHVMKTGEEKEAFFNGRISCLESRILVLSVSFKDEKAMVNNLQGIITSKNSKLESQKHALELASAEKSNIFNAIENLEAQNAQLILNIEKELNRKKESVGNTSIIGENLESTLATFLKIRKNFPFNNSEMGMEYEKKSYHAKESDLQEVLQHNQNLNKVYREIETSKMKDLSSDLVKLTSSKQHILEEYNSLLERHEKMVRNVNAEKVQMENEWASLSALVPTLQNKVDTLNEEMRIMENENNRELSMARAKLEEKNQRVENLQSDLHVSHALVESLQRDLGSLKYEEEELTRKRERGDQELLKSFIDTRLELAYAQEETVRLRNTLTKTIQKGITENFGQD